MGYFFIVKNLKTLTVFYPYAITNIDITYNGSYYGTDLFAGTVIGNNNTVTKNTTDITATYSTATGGTHKIATTSAEGESMIALQSISLEKLQ